jgi:SAM-dependent methyltransferase
MTHGHPIFARVYPVIARAGEQRGTAEHRQALLAGLRGRVIEVGAGNGLNFPHYPQGVTEVIAIEPEPHLRGLAEHTAAAAPVPVRVSEGIAEALPAADGELDAAVTSLVLCSVADQATALREIARALRPGGELRFYEHVIGERRGQARMQRAMDATFWPLISGGCHCARDTTQAIRDAGFQIERHERIPFKVAPLFAPVDFILGVARRT